MFSDFDKEHIDAIIRNEDGKFDWFTAKLLQFLARCPYFLLFDKYLNPEVEAIMLWRANMKDSFEAVPFYSGDELSDAMDALWRKGDLSSKGLLILTGMFNEPQYLEDYKLEQNAAIEIFKEMMMGKEKEEEEDETH